MPDFVDTDAPKSSRNPLFWIVLIVIGLVLYLFLGTDRRNTVASKAIEKSTEFSGEIDRKLLVPPGMRARQFVEDLRAKGQPYALDSVFEKAQDYFLEGSLADAHLLFFFGAREGHISSMMRMAEMSDPNLFQAENSLLDHADAMQSYKWYVKASEQGQTDVSGRIQGLQQWARQESETGNPYARQLLLVVQ